MLLHHSFRYRITEDWYSQYYIFGNFLFEEKQRFFQGNCVSHQHISQVLYSSPVTKRPSAVGAAEEQE